MANQFHLTFSSSHVLQRNADKIIKSRAERKKAGRLPFQARQAPCRRRVQWCRSSELCPTWLHRPAASSTHDLQCGNHHGFGVWWTEKFIRRTRGGDHGIPTVSFPEGRSDVFGFHFGSGFRARFHFLLWPIEILLKEPRSVQSTQRDPASMIHFTGKQLLPFEFPVPALLTARIRLKSQKKINSHNLTTKSFNN